MIYTENTTINGLDFTHTYSKRYYIERDGVEYADAYDPTEFGRVYSETKHELEDLDVSGEEIDENIQD